MERKTMETLRRLWKLGHLRPKRVTEHATGTGTCCEHWTRSGTRTVSSAAAATAASARSAPRSTPAPTSSSAAATTSGSPSLTFSHFGWLITAPKPDEEIGSMAET